MNEKEFRQIAQEELSKQIMENLNRGIIFKYINTLEERNKDLEQIEKEHKEENGRLRDTIKELEKEIIYWKEQAEGYQGLVEQIKEDFENRDRWE